MAIIGSAYVEIRALDTNLQRDIDKAMKKVKEPLITLQSNVNLTPVREKIRVLREELRRNPLKFSAEVDLDRVHEHIDAAYELYRENPLKMETEVNRAPVEAALESIRTRYGTMTSTINTNADTTAAEAQIGFAARNRSSRIDVMGKIDPEYQKALKGLFYTLTGALPADKIKSAFVGLASNLEMAAVGAAKMLTIVGSVSSAVLTLGANVLSIGGDLTDLVGFAALAPAVFLGFGAAIATVTMAWKGFGAAVTGKGKKGAEALAGLPPEAQDAAIAMRGLGKSIKEAAQGSYWKEMGTALQKMTDSTVPKLRDGLKGTGTSMALMTKGLLASVKGFADSGKMDTFFQHLNAGLSNASKGVKPFFDAIFTLGTVGSKYLDKMGVSAADLGIRFNNWITAAEKSGKINIWIAQAKKTFGDLNRTLGATTGIFEGLTKASRISGGKGLTEFADGMQKIAKIVNGEPFQSKLITILRGARRGTEALAEGFGKVKKVIGDSTAAISGFLGLAGQIGGSFLSNFSKMFENTGIGEGLIVGLYGFKKSVDAMEPTFTSLGILIGDLGEISGTLFQQMAPGLNNLMDTLQKVVAAVKDGVIAAMPVFNEFVQNILQVMAPIVIAIADAFGNLLEIFAGLPGGIQNIIMAFGLMLLLKPKFDKFFQSMSYRMDRWKSSIGDTVQRSQGFRTQMSDNFRYAGAAAGYASSTIAKSLGNVRDNFRLTGMIAGDAVRTTFGQLKSKVGPSMSEFGAGVKNGFKQAFTISPDLKAGFQRDIKEPFQAVGKGVAGVGRAISGEMKMVADHTKAYFSQLPAQAKKTWQNLPQIAKEEFTGVKNTVGYHMGEAADKVRDRSIYASKHLHDMGDGINNAVKDVKAGSTAMGNHIRAMVSPAESAVMRAGQSVAKSYNGMVLAGTMGATVLANKVTPVFDRIGQSAQRAFQPIASAASTAYGKVSETASRIGQSAQRSFDSVASAASSAYGKASEAAARAGQVAKDHASRAGQAVATGYNNMVLASTVAGTAMGRQVGDAASKIGTKIGDAATAVGRHASSMTSSVGRTFTSITTASTTAATSVGNAFKSAATNVRNNFAPVGAAIRETFSSVGSHLRPAVTAVGELGTAAGGALKSIGATAGAGLRAAAGGLLGALGGPWGIAIAAAATAVALIGESSAKSKAEVEKLASMLDQQSGKMTGASTLEAQKKLFDGATNSWDDFHRGVLMNSGSVTETLDRLGISTKKYSETMLDPKGRTAMVDGMHDVAFALKHARPITDEMAASIGTTKEKLEGMNLQDATKLGDSLEWAAGKATGMASQIDAAQKTVTDLAKATGVNTAQAAILAKNYDTLALSTSSANDKFLALKENIEILNKSPLKVDQGQKGYQQTIRDTAAAIKAVREENNGLVTNLFDVKKGFDFTSQAGADLHTALDGQSDGILKLGTKALDASLKNNESLDVAQKKAITAMAPAIEGFKKTLADMGFVPSQVDAIVASFGLVPKDLKTSLKVEGTDAAVAEIFRASIAADAFKSGNYTAVLTALPDAAKKEIEESTGLAGAFAKGDYGAILTALDNTKGGRDQALFEMVKVKNGKYEGILTSKDGTALGVKLANGTIATFKGKEVWLTAKDGTTQVIANIKSAVEGLKGKEITITTVYEEIRKTQGTAAANSYVDNSGMGNLKGSGADGGIVRSLSNMFGTSLSLAKVKSFANGGVENHVAQISSGQTPFRVWSEPETGGEAYIPLSKAKRSRSTKILEEVARMFGMTLLKTKSFANGGVEGGSAAGSSAGSLSTTHVSSALLNSVAKEMMKDNTNLNKIGEFVVDGIIGGVNNKSGDAVDTMTDMAGSLEQAVRTRLEIHSPSKTFLGLGKHIVDGLTVGIKDNTPAVQKRIATLANQIYVAASDIQKATGRSIGSSMAMLNHQKTLNVAWKKMPVWKYADQIVDYYQKTGKTGNRTLADIVRAREDVNVRLTAANDKLKNLQTARADVFKSVSSQIRGEYKLGTSIIGQDRPYIPKMKFSDVMSYTSGMAARLRGFNGKISALKKKGIAPALIQEVAMLGSIEGTSVADALLQGTSAEVKNLNSQYAQVGAMSNAIGNTTADAMYKVGIDAQAGLVRGLQKDSASLTAAANHLTNTLVAQVKKNLGIRSPSRVFAELGRFTGAGFIQGLDQMQPRLNQRVESFINLDPRQATSTSAGVTSTTTTSPLAEKNITVNVHPSEGMDERAVAKATITEIGWAILSQ